MSLPTYAGIEAYGFSCQEQLLSQRSVARAYPGGAVEKNLVESMRTAPVFHCRLCGELLNDSGLSLKRMPVCNRFTASKEPVERHDLRLDQCARCQLIQLCEALPVDAVTPRVPWIKYREPEDHLDSVVDRLLSGHCSKAGSSFGVGPFDQALLYRLEQHGLSSLVLETRPPQLGERKGFPYLETWQLGLNAANLAEIAYAYGKADIVSCRYLLEHCDDPLDGLRGLRQLISADGVLIVEVPDSTKFLAASDYSFIWEEHISYFVESTLRLLAAKAGYGVVDFHRYPGELEDALVAVLRPSASEGGADVVQTCSSEPDLFRSYVSGLQPTRDFVRSSVAAAAGPSRDGVALFGIGHQAVMFVNAFGLPEYVAAAVDDDLNKCGYFPPGFRVPVIPSQALLRDNRIQTCLIAVAPGIEHKIRDKLAPLLERGVQFRSIFAGVPGSLLSGRSSWH
jgi:Methyltransferase domain/Putative zinc binding domain/C-methyltransferase C-terminal domain